MTATRADRAHGFAWRLCPACGHKVEKHSDSSEFWDGPRKQLAHRGRCAKALRHYLNNGGTLDSARRDLRNGGGR